MPCVRPEITTYLPVVPSPPHTHVANQIIGRRSQNCRLGLLIAAVRDGGGGAGQPRSAFPLPQTERGPSSLAHKVSPRSRPSSSPCCQRFLVSVVLEAGEKQSTPPESPKSPRQRPREARNFPRTPQSKSGAPGSGPLATPQKPDRVHRPAPPTRLAMAPSGPHHSPF